MRCPNPECPAKLVEGLKMTSGGLEMTEKVMGTDLGNRDWVAIGRAVSRNSPSENFMMFALWPAVSERRPWSRT